MDRLKISAVLDEAMSGEFCCWNHKSVCFC